MKNLEKSTNKQKNSVQERGDKNNNKKNFKFQQF